MPLAPEQPFTYADLLSRKDGQRYELWGGRLRAMSSPSDQHQAAALELGRQFGNFLLGKPCNVYPAPFDVRLFEQEGEPPEAVDTVVQPDLLVVCDSAKVDRRGVHSAPDLVIEILSDSTRQADWREKLRLYQKAGAKEYWIADPVARFVAVHLLREGCYDPPVFYTRNARVPSGLWEGFSVDLTTVFPE